jgi:hypothetical protein
VNNSPPDRIGSLLAEVAALREAETELRKCEAFVVDEDVCTTRARKIYTAAVRLVGGETVVAKSEGVHRTAVLRRQENPNIRVHLAHVLAMPDAAIELVAEELHLIAAEKRRLRRAG